MIAAFGSMFLMMLFLDFLFEPREVRWLTWLERPLGRLGRLPHASVALALVVLTLSAETLTDQIGLIMVAGVLGIVTYLLINGLGELFSAVDIGVAANGVVEGPPQHDLERPATVGGKAAFSLFLYLEVA